MLWFYFNHVLHFIEIASTSTKRSSNWKQFVFACNSAKMRSYISPRSRCLPERYVYYPRSRYSFSFHLFLPLSASHSSSLSLFLILYLSVSLSLFASDFTRAPIDHLSHHLQLYLKHEPRVPHGIFRTREIVFVRNSRTVVHVVT